MTKEDLIKKIQAGGQITVDDLKALGSRKKRNPDERPPKVCSPKNALAKAKKGIELNRWELEELANSPEHAVEYAEFKGARFHECEKRLIASNKRGLITSYFFNVVKEPSEDLEGWLIVEGHDLIAQYCVGIRKSRWNEAEDAILKIKDRWNRGITARHALAYQEGMGIGRWDDLERLILNGKSEVADRPDSTKEYFKNCGPGRHRATEKRLVRYGNTSAIYLYAKLCVRGRLPNELHNKMILSGKKSAKKYLAWLSFKKKSALAYLRSLDGAEREELLGMCPETLGRTG